MNEVTIAVAVARVRERVSDAAARAGRDPDDVTVVAVTKGVDVDAIAEAGDSGIADFGENRAQDLAAKSASLDAAAGGARFARSMRWHFVGTLQTNKVRYLDRVSLIHSLDRLREAEALQARGDRLDRHWDVLVEVNIAGEPQKGGVPPEEVDRLVDGLAAYPRVRPRGLMFVAPQVENAQDVRAMFARTRALGERLSGYGLRELSMGMSDDFEVAVEEGSTIVRIGRAIFAPVQRSRRPATKDA
jgi:pyridoxal phosphate enzyme (YggS family)